MYISQFNSVYLSFQDIKVVVYLQTYCIYCHTTVWKKLYYKFCTVWCLYQLHIQLNWCCTFPAALTLPRSTAVHKLRYAPGEGVEVFKFATQRRRYVTHDFRGKHKMMYVLGYNLYCHKDVDDCFWLQLADVVQKFFLYLQAANFRLMRFEQHTIFFSRW